jgi:NADH-dependent peroxiredoxin subunit C
MSCGCNEEPTMDVLRLGDEVPNFTLETFDPAAGDFGEFSLEKTKAAKRWTILMFYPGDFTFVCTTEFAALAEKYDTLKKLGADVITVSTDSKHVHLAWHQNEAGLKKVRYPMAADRTTEVSRLFGVWDEASGDALRGTFIINPAGKLLAAEVNYFNVGRNMDELLRRFKAFLHVAKYGDEVCPAQWHDEGDATLIPGAKLVGNVYKDDGTLK